MTKTTFLAIGHLCNDVTSNGYIIGGSAAYSTITARNLGYRSRAITAVGENFNRDDPLLNAIEIEYHSSKETTIFDNRYDSEGRRQQYLLGMADRLTDFHISENHRSAEIVYLCPIADEVDPMLARSFKNSLIGVTPQGWMRQWTRDRRVKPKRWRSADEILPHVDILVLSDEDLVLYPDDLDRYVEMTEIVVLTKGKHGATLYTNGEVIEYEAYKTIEVDPTGAGDVFAAAFLISYNKNNDCLEALNFAHCVASFAVEGKGTTKIPTLEMVNQRLKFNSQMLRDNE